MLDKSRPRHIEVSYTIAPASNPDLSNRLICLPVKCGTQPPVPLFEQKWESVFSRVLFSVEGRVSVSERVVVTDGA
jgi:hypothetical protein